MTQEPDGLTEPVGDRYRPWTRRQVRVVDSWPTRRDQPVSVALSPTGDRLAVSVGYRLSVLNILQGSRVEPRIQMACALVPGLTWSPGGDKLAFRDGHGQGRIIEPSAAVSVAGAKTRMPAAGAANVMAFAPDKDWLAVLAPSSGGQMALTVKRPNQEAIWGRELTKNLTSSYHTEAVNLAFSPDGHLLACTTGTSEAWVFDTATGRQVRRFDDHSQTVTGISWIDDERLLSASTDATLRIWRLDDSAPSTVVETIAAAGMIFVRERRTALIWSARGELLAWSLEATPTQLWYREPPLRGVAAHFTRLAVSAVDGLLAVVDAGSTDLLLISDWDRAVSAPPTTTTYANAKVLLLGDSGVGKSGLAMVLAGEKFTPTESTHGRRIWRLAAPEAIDAAEMTEERNSSADGREVLLWDLAGQPGYRIVHQLHLAGAALALILFDAKSEVAPLDGVEHWARAVRHAHPAATGGLMTFLVAGRADRGGIGVSNERIRKLRADFGLAAYFRTSAREGTNVDGLRAALLAAIDWTRIPEVTSTKLFAAVKQFVVDQKSSGELLTPVNELCRLFQMAVPNGQQLLAGDGEGGGTGESSADGLISVFEGCIARLEAVGLVKRLKFGNYVLLQPEFLDTYAGAIVNAAKDEPDGLGSILETKVVSVDFPVPAAERVRDRLQERLLVLATLEELLLHELVLREPTEDGVQLVFPSAYRRDLPTSEMPKGDGVIFRFEGPMENIYATLIVRLTRSDRFRRVDAWQSAARFAGEEGTCTIALKFEGEGEAELLIGYDRAPEVTRKQFERFVHAHLERWATPGTITRERQYSCPDCGVAFTAEMVRQVNRRGRLSILCPVCEERVPLRDDYEVNGADQATALMAASADAGREIEAATAVLRGKTAVLRGKEEVAEYDVFISYHWRDKDAVRLITQQLKNRGLRPWMDERQLRPGSPWLPDLEDIIQRVPAAALIIGAKRGPWQDKEIYAFIQQSVSRGCAIVPVLLPDADTADLPVFLQGLTWVNLAAPEPNPIDQLVWGVTGQQLSQ